LTGFILMTVLYAVRWGVLCKRIKHRHNHLIRIKCGKVISFQDDLLEGLEGKEAVTAGFRVVNHEVRLYGFV
jgi:Fe2+ or Zn2+ uptake regulation protein